MNYAVYRERTLGTARAIELRLEIENFHAEYCAVLDAGLVEQWPRFFTEDALYRITARENAELNLPVGLVYAEGIGMMRDRAVRHRQYADVRAALQPAPGDQHARHRRDGGRRRIVAQANFMLLQTLVEGPTTMHMAGTYHDRFQRTGNRLLLRERQVIYDTTIIANDLVYPV
ncbi:aromatic-ring-hydroxylating dioxygenase subunit beta [Cupriavidus basilensis]